MMNKYKDLFTTYKDSKLIYLDSASTTQKPDVVISAINNYLSEISVNPDRGSYSPSNKRSKQIEDIRQKVADFINAESPKDIVFTSGATESINAAMYSWALYNLENGDEILLCQEDHQSTILPWIHLKELLKKMGKTIELKYYTHTQYLGNADIESIKSQITSKTKLIVLTHIHNVYGTLTNVQSVRDIAGNIPILLDASQSISHIPVNVQDLGIDFLVFSGHKMFALEGIGVLYVNPKHHSELHTFMAGSSVKDKHTAPYTLLEVGSLNLVGIISLGAAIDFINYITFTDIHNYINKLMIYLSDSFKGMVKLIATPGYLYDKNQNGYGIISFNISGVSSGDVGEYLNLNKICVRTGNHCTYKKDTSLQDSIRASIHIYNTKEDIDQLVGLLRKC
jgi:cysteine desulfurase/selenocysteine lyase